MSSPAPDTVVEIPPPEALGGEPKRWLLPMMLIALLVGVAGLAFVTAPRLPAIEWALQEGPTGSINLDSLVAIDEGFALLSGMTAEGVLLWWTDDGVSWESRPLAGAPSQLAPLDDALIAYGVRVGRIIQRGTDTWVEGEDVAFPDQVRSRQASGRPSILGSSDALVVLSLFGDLWFSNDGSSFVESVSDPDWGPGVERPFDSACRPPMRSSPDVPPIVRTDTGYVAMVSSNPLEPFGIWPVCEPTVWFSTDGSAWAPTESSFADGAYVYDLAWREGRYTAVGGFGIGEPAAWTSEDGVVWDPMPSVSADQSIDLFSIDAGPGGWVMLGRAGEDRSRLGWTSIDGQCWEEFPWYVDGGDAVVSRDWMAVVDRPSYPEFWMATVTGDGGSCR